MEIKETASEKSKRDFLLVKDALENKNQKAYSELMSYYREPIYYMVFKMTNNPYDAEDLTIEAFGKAFKNLDKYTSEYAFSTWLFKIAANNAIDHLRKKQNSLPCIDEDLFSCENSYKEIHVQQTHITPEDTYIEKQRIKMMHWAVGQLRPKYRDLIELRYFQELSYEEIATTLNVSVNNVKIQLFRAKEMLSKIMDTIKYTI